MGKMIYSDGENATWWKRLPKQDQREIFDTIMQKASSTSFRMSADRMRMDWENGKGFTPKQLAVLRKWSPTE